MSIAKNKYSYFNREISWLSFNERVIQEAEDDSVPLIERLRFLGIYSNNLDEFYRVRVAVLNRLLHLGDKAIPLVGDNPALLLKKISKIELRLRKKYANSYNAIVKELEQESIFIIDEKKLNDKQSDFVKKYFREKVRPTLGPIMLDNKNTFPRLIGSAIYFAVKITESNTKIRYAVVEIPSQILSRFLILPEENNNKYVILLDDVIRYCIDEIFSIIDCEKIEAYTLKITRDAELDIEDNVLESAIKKLSASVKKRKKGDFVRFIYDKKIPKDLYDYVLSKLKIKSADERLIAGGRYHNFKDFMGFPDIGAKRLTYKRMTPIIHEDFKDKRSMLDVLDNKDVLLSVPYQSFSNVINLLREAAIDPLVTSIKISLYRVAPSNSQIIHALINAANNGKKVTAIIELRARFDESTNIYWSDKLQEAKVKVIFGVPNLKVHAKILLITRKESEKVRRYAFIGTGNFNEKIASVYSDIALLTSNKKITNELNKVFNFFKITYKRPVYRHLIVSPFSGRRKYFQLIQTEILNAKKGEKALIIIKLNNLVDKELINKLYEASNSGVEIKLIIRGICSLVPGVKGISENIEVRSIVDRFLEHSRVLYFYNSGKELFYITSSDWMRRNIEDRVEVGVPVYDEKIQRILKDMLLMQLNDNSKARIIDARQKNNYAQATEKKIQSQNEIFKYFSNKLNK